MLIPIVISSSLGSLERAIMYAFSIRSFGSWVLSFLILSAKCLESVHKNFELRENRVLDSPVEVLLEPTLAEVSG